MGLFSQNGYVFVNTYGCGQETGTSDMFVCIYLFDEYIIYTLTHVDIPHVSCACIFVVWLYMLAQGHQFLLQ